MVGITNSQYFREHIGGEISWSTKRWKRNTKHSICKPEMIRSPGWSSSWLKYIDKSWLRVHHQAKAIRLWWEWGKLSIINKFGFRRLMTSTFVQKLHFPMAVLMDGIYIETQPRRCVPNNSIKRRTRKYIATLLFIHLRCYKVLKVRRCLDCLKLYSNIVFQHIWRAIT